MKILYLPVCEEYFHLIKDGIKPEEYRQIKPYWCMRLLGEKHTIKYWQQKWLYNVIWDGTEGKRYKRNLINEYGIADYTHVMFTCGYPTKDNTDKHILKEITEIAIGKPHKGWCPDSFLNDDYFIIKFKQNSYDRTNVTSLGKGSSRRYG